MNLPDKTSDIFEPLSKGQFICSNSTDEFAVRLYDVIHENEDVLYDYFIAINFILERGDEFFYFSKRELKADLEAKILRAEKWIDLIDFLKAYDSSFTNGYRFYPADNGVRIRVDVNLRDKLENLKRHIGELKNYDTGNYSYGNVNQNLEPLPSLLTTPISPSWCFIISEDM